MAYQKINFVNNSAPPINATNLNHMDQGIYAAHEQLDGLVERYGTPLVAHTAAEMTDTQKIYVYVGSESGYQNGYWYYYDGSAWQVGDVYQSQGINTDASLTQANMAADAKATGDAVSVLKSAITKISPINIYGNGVMNDGGVNANTGANQSSSTLKRTNYIDITGISKIKYTRIHTTNSSATWGMAFYDSEKTYISGQKPVLNADELSYALEDLDVPNDAVYARFSWTNTFGTPIEIYNAEQYDASAYARSTTASISGSTLFLTTEVQNGNEISF